MTSLRAATTNTAPGSSSSASQSPLTPVVQITRLRTPTPQSSVSTADVGGGGGGAATASALPLTATVKREEVANEEIKVCVVAGITCPRVSISKLSLRIYLCPMCQIYRGCRLTTFKILHTFLIPRAVRSRFY